MFNIFRKKKKLTEEELYAIGYNLGKGFVDVSIFDELGKKYNEQRNTNINAKMES